MKKIAALILALVMVLSLAACGGSSGAATTDGGNSSGGASSGSTSSGGASSAGTSSGGASQLAGTYKILVWTGEAAVDLTRKQIEDFNASNEYGIVFEPEINPVSEATAADQMLVDINAGADLYCFPQDQFARLVQANALSKLGDAAKAFVIENNDPGVVAAATTGEEIYAYPLTSDNGYFMYYDKSVIPEEDVDSLEKLIADCEANNKLFAFEAQTSAWYIVSWFFATGCVSEWTTDDAGNFISVNDNFNSDNGLVAVKGMEKLLKSPCHKSSSAADEFANGAAVVVTGTWAYEDISKILGENMGVTDLPSFEVDGKEYHLGSFNGCKLMGVKPQADAVRGAALHRLAQYLTGEACQMERFNELSWGPSNLADQASPEVQANPGLSALLLQGAYSRPQGQIHGSWWNIANVIADEVKAAGSEDDLKAALQNYYNKINDLFKLDASALLFVGAWNGWNNADDADTYYLADNGDGTFSLTLDVPEGDYMGGRIVSPGDWGADKGFAQVTSGAELLNADAAGDDNNIVFTEPGNYTVTWDGAAITIVKN